MSDLPRVAGAFGSARSTIPAVEIAGRTAAGIGSRLAANEPVAAFDHNGKGRIDVADNIRLFNQI